MSTFLLVPRWHRYCRTNIPAEAKGPALTVMETVTPETAGVMFINSDMN